MSVVSPRLDLRPDHWAIVLDILRQHVPDRKVLAFGSRATWTAKDYSDLDLAILGDEPLSLDAISAMAEGFGESDLPFKVDLVDWATVDETFRDVIHRDGVEVQLSANTIETAWRLSLTSGNACVLDKWRESTWGEEISLEYGKALKGYDTSTGPFRVFGSNGPIGWSDEALAPGPGVILGRKGAYRGVAYTPNPFFVIDTAYYVVSKSQHDMRWLFYAIKYYKLGEIDDGSPIPSTTRAAVYLRELTVPPPPEQRAIAHILGTLDDKIELNRRTNETLEAMARALFKSWFVDFDPVRAKMALNHSPLEGESQPDEPPGDSGWGGGTNRRSPQASRWGEVKHSYSGKTLNRAKSLRRNQTDAEGLLWHYLRNKQLDGYKFRRQQPIGPCIVDFACLPEKLLIELDGGQHAEQEAYDERRDQFLQSKGYRVLRFWNNEIFDNCFAVLEQIYHALINHSPLEGESQSAIADVVGGIIPPLRGSDWTVERARAYLDRMDPKIADLFPDKLVDSEIGEVPEGWETGYLSDIASSPRRSINPANLEPGTPSIGLDHMPRYSIALAEWQNSEKVTSNKFAFKEGEFLFGKLRPYFHKVGIAPVNGICSTDIVVIAPIETAWSAYVLATISSFEFVNYTDQTSTGTRMPRTSWGIMSSYTLCLPPERLVQELQNATEPMLSQVVTHVKSNRNLASLRDTLLPKLISGELRVDDKIDVEVVV